MRRFIDINDWNSSYPFNPNHSVYPVLLSLEFITMVTLDVPLDCGISITSLIQDLLQLPTIHTNIMLVLNVYRSISQTLECILLIPTSANQYIMNVFRNVTLWSSSIGCWCTEFNLECAISKTIDLLFCCSFRHSKDMCSLCLSSFFIVSFLEWFNIVFQIFKLEMVFQHETINFMIAKAYHGFFGQLKFVFLLDEVSLEVTIFICVICIDNQLDLLSHLQRVKF